MSSSSFSYCTYLGQTKGVLVMTAVHVGQHEHNNCIVVCSKTVTLRPVWRGGLATADIALWCNDRVTLAVADKQLPAASFTSCLTHLKWYKQIISRKMTNSRSTMCNCCVAMFFSSSLKNGCHGNITSLGIGIGTFNPLTWGLFKQTEIFI